MSLLATDLCHLCGETYFKHMARRCPHGDGAFMAPDEHLGMVVELLGSVSLSFRDERMMQLQFGQMLTQSDVAFTREHRLSSADRVDFWLDKFGMAIELKCDGSLSDVTRQLMRYAQHDSVCRLLLVTSKMRHRNLPRTMAGKLLSVAYLSPLG